MTPQRVILFNILKDPESFPLEVLGALKRDHFTNKYDKEIFHNIRNYYQQYGKIPSLEELRIFSRSTTLDAFDIPPDYEYIDTHVALDSIEATYIQRETLSGLKKLVGELDSLAANEVIPKIITIANELEDKLNTNDRVSTNKGFRMFMDTTVRDSMYKPVGICNAWDGAAKGLLPGEVLLIGGKRGSGKSVISANIGVSQYCMGLIAPYFTIEMTGDETRTRMFSILSGVDQTRLKQQKLQGPELVKALITRSYTTINPPDVPSELDIASVIAYDEALSKLEEKLELIIIDDRDLSLSVIDLTLGQLANKFGSRMSMAIVDYVNVVRSDESQSSVDNLDWKIQMVLSQSLKNLARKYSIPFVSPYQIDNNGEARLAKGLLDSVDFAYTLSKDGSYLSLGCAKARGGEEINYTTYILWKALKIITDMPAKKDEETDDDTKNPE